MAATLQLAVDAKHSLIVEQHVTNACNDMGLLTPAASAAMEGLGVERIDVVAGMRYRAGDDIVACEAVKSCLEQALYTRPGACRLALIEPPPWHGFNQDVVDEPRWRRDIRQVRHSKHLQCQQANMPVDRV